MKTMKHTFQIAASIVASLPCAVPVGAATDGPGFSVDVFAASDKTPRNSEGSIIELSDGRLLLATTRFVGGARDNSAAHIAAVTRRDRGDVGG